MAAAATARPKAVVLPPLSFEWANPTDGEQENTMLVAAYNAGRVTLQRIDFGPSIDRCLPTSAEVSAPLTRTGSVAAYYPMPDQQWLVTSVSFVDSSLWTVVDASAPATVISRRGEMTRPVLGLARPGDRGRGSCRARRSMAGGSD